MRSLFALVAAAVAALSAAACTDAAQVTATDGAKHVAASTYPIHYVTARIAGGAAAVACVLPPGADLLHFTPDRAQLERLQRADLILLNGAESEGWAFQASLPISRVIETAERFRDRYQRLAGGITHTHADGSSHTHAGVDPFTWVDPRNLIEQAEAVRDALRKLLPDAQAELDARFEDLRQDLLALDASLAALPLRDGEVLVAAQECYGYAATRHGWQVANVPLDMGALATPEDVARIKAAFAGNTARVVLWPAEPGEAWRSRLQEACGLRSVVFAPCTTPPAGGDDYLTVMRRNAAALRAALQDG